MGLGEALSLTVTVPDFSPFDFGENVALIAQFSPAGKVDPHVEVTPNCPVVFIEDIFSVAAPVLVSVTVWGGLVVPTACSLKLRGVVGEKLTVPVLSRTTTSLKRWSATTRSFFWSPLKSPVVA